MSKLRFDPVVYQFYFKCDAAGAAHAKAAGFGWDPARRRYFTEDPKIAIALARWGDDYVMDLLTDALEIRRAPTLFSPGALRRWASIEAPPPRSSIASQTIH